MKTKICSKCNKEKELSEFFKAKTGKYGVRGDCKDCIHIISVKVIEREQLILKGLKKCSHCDQIKSIDKFYKDNSKKNEISGWCADCLKEAKKKYIDNNKEQVLQQRKKSDKNYYKKNKKKIIKQQVKQRRLRRKTDINFKLSYNLRCRLTLALQGKSKSKRTLELLGCTVEELKLHLESLFTEDMSWDNHGFGNDKWHIDHIKPCRLFDFTDSKQQDECFHFSNLQPLWQKDNFKKGSKYEA